MFQLTDEQSVDAVEADASTRTGQPPSPLAEQQGEQLLRQLDGYSDLRGMLGEIADKTDDYSGIPMPLEGLDLIVEPTFPNAKGLMEICKEKEDTSHSDELEAAGCTPRTSFYSTRRKVQVHIVNHPSGKVRWGWLPRGNNLVLLLHTMDAQRAWGIEQEAKALQLLGTLLEHHKFKQYLMTGSFLETSSRSGVMYLFRKLRPTVAITTRGEDAKILCTLCMHPIGYYHGSWAGVMCPTDDVIAHLMLMRADEHMFWRRCNQHHAAEIESGLT
jgi:hypothetical protein